MGKLIGSVKGRAQGGVSGRSRERYLWRITHLERGDGRVGDGCDGCGMMQLYPYCCTPYSVNSS